MAWTMNPSLGLLVVLAAVLAGSYAATSEIIRPIKAAGEEVGLIFVPGASIKGEAYRKTARAIQEASELRVWVALTGNFTAELPNPIELPGAVSGAVNGLKAAGMKSSNYVGVGHSLGGIVLAPYTEKSSLKALVLLGSYINRNTRLEDYTKPVLTLSAELDGQTRITRIAVDYEQLLGNTTESSKSIYRTPVINIRGASHAQFASGPMPPRVKKLDLKPVISEQEAHAAIGRSVSSFLAVTFSSAQAIVDASKKRLDDAFNDSGKRFLPLLQIKALDVKGGASPWALECQKMMARYLASKIRVQNTIFEATQAFLKSKPSLNKQGSSVVINTTALVSYVKNPFDFSSKLQSPIEIDVKMKSRGAIKQALNATIPNSFDFEKDEDLTCRNLNEMAYKLALKHSTPDAQARYRAQSRQITFKDDIVYGTGLQWSSQPLVIEESDAGLVVQGVALVTSVTSPFFPGMHYCKVLSPYRAMEWINVDSLRTHKP